MTFPARGTWIEIRLSPLPPTPRVDVPRKGNVDRNVTDNLPTILQSGDVPRKGNVDRNLACRARPWARLRTFPARGTWIEIGRRARE